MRILICTRHEAYNAEIYEVAMLTVLNYKLKTKHLGLE
jgi:hypothetical protein